MVVGCQKISYFPNHTFIPSPNLVAFGGEGKKHEEEARELINNPTSNDDLSDNKNKGDVGELSLLFEGHKVRKNSQSWRTW